LLTLQLVLDGGTGFLKAGYAGQVRLYTTIVVRLAKLMIIALELPRPPVPFNSRPSHSTNRRTKWRWHPAQGHHVRWWGCGSALNASDHLPSMWPRKAKPRTGTVT